MLFKKKSIVSKLLFPLLLVMVVQAALFFGTVIVGGTVEQLKDNAVDSLSQRTSARKNELENRMVQSWSNVSLAVEEINQKVQAELEKNHMQASDLNVGNAATIEILEQTTNHVMGLMRRNAVTGAFLILNGNDPVGYPTDTCQKAGIYFRDNDPRSNPTEDNSDLLAEVAPPSIAQGLNITMDTMWKPSFAFSPQNGKTGIDYFYKPFLAAVEYQEMGYSDLGYWSPPFILNSTDKNDAYEMITYSVPLRLRDGSPYGVLGVEVSTSYLVSLLPSNDINQGDASGYILAVAKTAGQEESTGSQEQFYQAAVSSGSWAKWLLGAANEMTLKSNARYEQLRDVVKTDVEQKDAYASAYSLHLYNSHTPFENERWDLMGVVGGDVLFAFADSMWNSLIIALVASLAIGVAGIFVVSRFLTRPIQTLARKLKESDPQKPIQLESVHIVEVDELSQSIQTLSRQVAESASKLSRILGLAGIPIGAFEYTKGSDQILCTEQFFEIIDMPMAIVGSRQIPVDMMKKIFERLEKNLDFHDSDHRLYTYQIPKDMGMSWIRLKVVEDDQRILGVMTDVTQEIQEKKKIEYERDFDVLTNIYNRRAFRRKMNELFQSPGRLGIAALVMLDLDNLKYINDTYGHDYGDRYIQEAAKVLLCFTNGHVLVSRMSGDEFFAFFYGFTHKEEILEKIERMQVIFQESKILLPDQQTIQVRASAGIAWYPDDTTDFEELIRFADFAMYMVKRKEKGRFASFDPLLYKEWSYLLHGSEELNLLLEQKRVDYHFQPIVDAHTGDVFAYEALMRPNSQNIQTPTELLHLARSQSKLSQVERLTWFKSMEDFLCHSKPDAPYKIFINSISNQNLSEEDMALFESQYKEYLRRLVVELTEEEQMSQEATNHKIHMVQQWGAQIALDDFGSGYNSESVLVDLMPDYVKLDMSIGRNIHMDGNRQKMLQGLISYSKERGIKIIAEGVECREEMQTLIEHGVDYLQGYYLGRPQPDIQDIPASIREEIQELFAHSALGDSSQQK